MCRSWSRGRKLIVVLASALRGDDPTPVPLGTAAELGVEGFLGEAHLLLIPGLAESAHAFLRIDGLCDRGDPPDVAERIPDAGAALAESAVGQGGHLASTGSQGSVEGGVGVGHEHPQQRRHAGPVRALIEGEQHGVTDPDLGVPDAAVLQGHPAQFDAVEGGGDEGEQRAGVLR